ncbi:MAG: PAS domain S-box protein [Ignavibacteriales bacterium]|nr:MAG: PAS domain S-box protein [Ignavibacteriales bacterium]
MVNNLLKLLCLEDNFNDAELIFEVIVEAGYQIERNLTSSRSEFETLIRKNQYDIILSDFKLPGFDAFGALKLCKAICPDTPFICVSGSIGEETAIELLKQGAVDYILKDRLARLPFAIKRALEEAAEKNTIKEVERELTESEKRYRTLYENAKIGLYRTTPEGKILLANKTLIRMLGYQSFEELALKDLNKDGFSSRYKRKIFTDRIEKEGEVNDFESEWLCKDGTAIFVRESAQAIRGSDGKIIYYDGIVENITERKKAEEALKKSEEKLKELFEDAPVGYHEIDEFGNISAVNKTELIMLGYNYNEMIGSPIWKFSKDSKESQVRVIEKLAGVFPPNKNLEQLFVRKDGTTFPALVDDVIFRNDEGVITGIRTTILDITERKKIENELKELTLFQQAILASVPDIIMEVDNNKIYTWANNAGKEFFGDDVIGKEAAFYFEGEQKVYQQVQPLFNGNEDIIYVESWQRRKDGKKCLLAWWCKVLKDINGNIIGALSTARDITEQKKAEEDLRESERKLTEAQKMAQLGHWSWDVKTGDVEWSEEVYKIFQLDPKKFKPQIDSILEKSPWPNDHLRDKELISKATESREKGTYEQRFLRPDNSIGYYMSSFQGKYDEKGNLVTIIGTIQDITERKLAVEKINQLAAIVQSSDDAIYGKTLKGYITSWNKGAENIYGYTESEAIGKNISFLMHSENLDEVDEILQIVKSGRHVEHYETIRVHKDGHTINVSLTISPIKDSSGNIIAASTIARDITERKKTEEVLQNERLLLRTLIDNIPDSIYVKDLNFRKTLANPAEVQIMNAESEAEVLGKNDFDWYPNEIAEMFYTDDKSVLQGSPVFNKEEYILDKNGKKQWLLTSKLPLHDKDKNVIGLVGIGRNITARKISEDRQIVISNILSILNRPNEWQDIINDILNELKSFTGLEAVAIRLKEGNDYPNFVVNGFPENFVNVERSLCSTQLDSDKKEEASYLDCLCGNIICQRFDSSQPFYTESGSFWTNNTTELFNKYSDKELLTIHRKECNKEGYESVALIPLQSGDKVIGLLQLNDKRPNMFTLDMVQFFEKIGSTIGIAFKRMQIEKQIRESEERYRFIVDATNDVIYRLKYHSMKYDFMSSAIEKLTGYSPDDINEIGFKNIVVKISKYHVENVNIDLIVENRELGKTGEWQADYQVKTKDGRLIWLSDHSYPWYNDSGEVIGSIGVLGNITERKKAEEEIIRAKEKAEEMNKLKSNFLANMSHELRTPLIGILGFADMLREDLINDPREEYAQIIFDSGQRLKDTLNLILDLSKIESKGLEMNPEDIEITKYIPDLVKVFQKAAEQKNIELILTPSTELLHCKLDKVLLDSIINNLMNNAIKYTQKGSITVSVEKSSEPDKNTAEIQIADTGIGISKDNLAIIFEPFRQVSEGLNRRFEGTGLGLTLVKKYVEQMNGSISVKSEPGAGSTFTITFPVIKLSHRKTEQSAGGNKIMETLNEPEGKNKIRILYVEDDFVSQKVINSLIGKIYNLDFSSDGETALEMVRKEKYDIILMDINLRSNLNGLVVTKEIKKIKEYVNTPIIAVTAYAMIGDKEKILTEGCTHYISKPFSKNEILTLLDEVLNK